MKQFLSKTYKTVVNTAILLGMAYGSCCCLSCASDDGVYDYTQRNELTISMENDTVEQFTNLVVTPKITSTGNYNAADYTYLWYMWDANDVDPDTLSTERDLNVPINVSAGNYHFALEIRDKEGKLAGVGMSDLLVINSFSAGLAILSEADGMADVAFINLMGTVTESIYEKVNRSPIGSKPTCIAFIGNHYGVLPMVGIGTESGSVLTNSDDISYFGELGKLFYFPPANATLQAVKRDLYESSEFIIVNGGIHQRSLYFKGDPIIPFNARDGGMNYNLAPFIMIGYNYNPALFDQKTRSFLYDNFGEELLPVTVTASTTLFNPNDMKGDLVYADAFYTDSEDPNAMRADFANIRGVMRNDDGSLYAIGAIMEEGYDLDWNSFFAINPTHRVDVPREATHFAASSFDPNFMYYSIGSKIYCLSIVTGNVLSTVDLGKTVDYMEFDRTDPSKLYVAISDGSGKAKSGSILFMTPDTSGSLSETARYPNICGKVVDIDVK